MLYRINGVSYLITLSVNIYAVLYWSTELSVNIYAVSDRRSIVLGHDVGQYICCIVLVDGVVLYLEAFDS